MDRKTDPGGLWEESANSECGRAVQTVGTACARAQGIGG